MAPLSTCLGALVRCSPEGFPRSRRLWRLHRCGLTKDRFLRPYSSENCWRPRPSLRSALRRMSSTTMASADFSLRRGRRHPFRCEARSPQIRALAFPARPPRLRRLSLGHESFAALCPLALPGTASYAVLVHRPAVSLPASCTPPSRLDALRFASVVVTYSWRDFHPLVSAHAGRTQKKQRRLRSRRCFAGL